MKLKVKKYQTPAHGIMRQENPWLTPGYAQSRGFNIEAMGKKKPTKAAELGVAIQDAGTMLTNTLRNWGTNIPGDIIQGFSPKTAQALNDATGGILNHTTKEQLEANRSSPTKGRWRNSAVNTEPEASTWNNRVAGAAQGVTSIVGGHLFGAAVQKAATPLIKGMSRAWYKPRFNTTPKVLQQVPHGQKLKMGQYQVLPDSGPLTNAAKQNIINTDVRGALAKTNQVVGRPAHSDKAMMEALKNASMDDLLAMMGRSNTKPLYIRANTLEELTKHPGNKDVDKIFDDPKEFIKSWFANPITKKKLETNLKYKTNEDYVKMTKKPGVAESSVTPTIFENNDYYSGKVDNYLRPVNDKIDAGHYYGTLERLHPDWKDFQDQFVRVTAGDDNFRKRYFSDNSTIQGFRSSYKGGQNSVLSQSTEGIGGAKSTAAHEIIHLSDMDKVMGSILPESDWEPIIRDQAKDIPGYDPTNKRDTDLYRRVSTEAITQYESGSYDYLNSPVERYPKLMQLRYTGKLKPGEYVDDTRLKEVRKSDPTNPIWNLFSPKTVKFMLNFFASNDAKSNNTINQDSNQDINYA